MTDPKEMNKTERPAEIFRSLIMSGLDEAEAAHFEKAVEAAYDSISQNSDEYNLLLRDNLWLLLLHESKFSKDTDPDEEYDPMYVENLSTIVPTAVVGTESFLSDLADLYIEFHANLLMNEETAADEDLDNILHNYYQMMPAVREVMIIKSRHFDLFFVPKRFFHHLREKNLSFVDSDTLVAAILEFQEKSAFHDFDFKDNVSYFGLDYDDRRQTDRITEMLNDLIPRFESSPEYETLTQEQKTHAPFILRMTVAHIDMLNSMDDFSVGEMFDIDQEELEHIVLYSVLGTIYAPKEVFYSFGDVLIAFYRFLESEGSVEDASEQVNWLSGVKDRMYAESENRTRWNEHKKFFDYLVENQSETDFSENEWMTANLSILSFCIEEAIDIHAVGKENEDNFELLAEWNLILLEEGFTEHEIYLSMPEDRQSYVYDILDAYMKLGMWYHGPDCLQWTAAEVASLVVDHFPFQVALPDEAMHEVIPVLTAFYRFLEIKGRIADSTVRHALMRIDRSDMQRRASDPESWSMRKAMLMAEQEQGVDPSELNPDEDDFDDSFIFPEDEEMDYDEPWTINDIPAKADPLSKIGRNERVDVVYEDGRKVENIKFKKVVSDIKSGNCRLV